jgi:hypothetical protein
VPALLPEYVGRVDAVAELREACRAAVGWLVAGATSVTVLSSGGPDAAARARGISTPLGTRVARHLLDEAGYTGAVSSAPGDRLLVLANGSARRGVKAPGHLDPRSFPFDEHLETALAEGDSAALSTLDVDLGRELLASGIEQLRTLGGLGRPVDEARLSYAADPYGVRYWVATWSCA